MRTVLFFPADFSQQRQNLNEVENLYFHNSYLRNLRPTGGATKSQITTTANSTGKGGLLPAPVVDDPASVHQTGASSASDRPSGSSPHISHSITTDNTSALARPISLTSTVSSVQTTSSHQNQNGETTPPPSLPEPLVDAASTLQNVTQVPTVQPVQTSLASPSSTLDLSDPAILARLAQLQVQTLVFSQGQPPTQTQGPPSSFSHSQPTPTPFTTVPASQPGSDDQTHEPQFPIPSSQPFSFTSHPPLSFQQFNPMVLSTPQPLMMSTSTPSSAPLLGPPPLHPPSSAQFPTPSTALPLFSAPTFSPPPASPSISTTSAPQPPPSSASSVLLPSNTTAPASIPAPTHGLTYDSFWSSHISAAGTTRALYRTHTGFSASATPSGHVAMLTPGGHSAVMTADGVYVGGGAKAGS